MTKARIAEVIPDVRAAAVELSLIWPVRRYLGAESLRHVGASAESVAITKSLGQQARRPNQS